MEPIVRVPQAQTSFADQGLEQQVPYLLPFRPNQTRPDHNDSDMDGVDPIYSVTSNIEVIPVQFAHTDLV